MCFKLTLFLLTALLLIATVSDPAAAGGPDRHPTSKPGSTTPVGLRPGWTTVFDGSDGLGNHIVVERKQTRWDDIAESPLAAVNNRTIYAAVFRCEFFVVGSNGDRKLIHRDVDYTMVTQGVRKNTEFLAAHFEDQKLFYITIDDSGYTYLCSVDINVDPLKSKEYFATRIWSETTARRLKTAKFSGCLAENSLSAQVFDDHEIAFTEPFYSIADRKQPWAMQNQR